MRVMVAEDDPTIRQMMGTLLNRNEVPCTLTEDGAGTVEAWEQGDFDVIFMDVQMPNLDGIEATRMIREKEKSRGGHVLIIAMTAHTMPEDERDCLEAGMDGYISKPVDFDAVLSIIDNLAARKKG